LVQVVVIESTSSFWIMRLVPPRAEYGQRDIAATGATDSDGLDESGDGKDQAVGTSNRMNYRCCLLIR
jgi:hypothetical protein